jgi:hypothetical protein
VADSVPRGGRRGESPSPSFAAIFSPSKTLLIGREKASRLGFAVERIDRAVDVLVQANDRYADLSPMNRRRLARALFAGIYVRDRQIERFELVDGLRLVRRTADALAGGSNMNCLVELAGLEPATSWVRSRRSPS